MVQVVSKHRKFFGQMFTGTLLFSFYCLRAILSPEHVVGSLHFGRHLILRSLLRIELQYYVMA